MKKIIHITLSLVLAFSIVLGYAGVTVFKMVCAAEQGKTTVSVVDVKDDCSHKQKQEVDDCCKPNKAASTENNEVEKSCCDYSVELQKMEDQTLVNQIQSSANHFFITTVICWFKANQLNHNTYFNQLAFDGWRQSFALRKQPIQSYLQVYTI